MSVGDAAPRREPEAIFEKRASIAWPEIEAMLSHYGAEISEGRGSRVRIALNGVRAVKGFQAEDSVDDYLEFCATRGEGPGRASA